MASVFVEEYNSLCEAVSIVKGKKVYHLCNCYTHSFLILFDTLLIKAKLFEIVVLDIDECSLFGDAICKNGRCINTNESFRCECNPGYKYDVDSHSCYGNLSTIIMII